MLKKTRSLLEELESISANQDVDHLIENRANNVISSAINLIELINKKYSAEKADLLEKKLLSAIKGKDKDRFSKAIRKKDEENKS